MLDIIRKKDDVRKCVRCCRESLTLIPALVSSVVAEFGRFDIISIPAIEEGAILFGVTGSEPDVTALAVLIEKYPELEPWKAYAEKAQLILKLTPQLIDYVTTRPGCLQKDLKKALNASDGHIIASIVSALEWLGQLQRVRAGNSYALTCGNGAQPKQSGLRKNDRRWGQLNQQLLEAIKRNDLSGTLVLYKEMESVLKTEGRDTSHLSKAVDQTVAQIKKNISKVVPLQKRHRSTGAFPTWILLVVAVGVLIFTYTAYKASH